MGAKVYYQTGWGGAVPDFPSGSAIALNYRISLSFEGASN